MSPSRNSSYNAVPLLVHLPGSLASGKYLAAAESRGEFLLGSGQKDGRFIGGTIDNPDVIDKEAATLSLEAYLALHRPRASPDGWTGPESRGRHRRDLDLHLERADGGRGSTW